MMLGTRQGCWVVFWFISYIVLGGASPALAQLSDEAILATLQASSKLNNPDEVLADFINGLTTTRVIITIRPSQAAAALTVESVGEGEIPAEFQKHGAPPYYNLQDSSIRDRLRSAVEVQVAKIINEIASPEISITNRFSYQFGFSAIVTPAGLEQIVKNGDVLLIEKDRIQQAQLAQGIPLMNAASVRSTYNGSGVSIAITDTGIDTSHPRLGNGGSPIFNSKVIGGYDTGDNDADPRPGSSGTAHGTACAGIAGGNLGTTGDYIGGLAPGAKLYALKISFGTGGSAYDSDTIDAWNWVITHKNDDPNNPIKIISHSFGGGRYYSACDSSLSSLTTAAANVVAAGITIFASSGNNGYCGSMGAPACISFINSVGAVYDANFGTYYPCIDVNSCATKYYTGSGCSSTGGYYAKDATSPDKVTSYSNSASFLTLLGPANSAYTTDIVGAGGYSTGDYDVEFGGTSAACPYAAGAAAVLQSAAKAKTGSFLTPAQVRQYLVTNGDNITDTKVAVTRPRVNLGRAVDAISGGGPTPPPITSAFPWAMFQPAMSGKPDPNTYWSALSYVYCPSSVATFSLTSGGVTKRSSCQAGGCAGGAGTFEGWVTTTPGNRYFSWTLSAPTCGTWGNSFAYPLVAGKNYRFLMRLNSSNQPAVYVATGTGRPYSAAAPAVADPVSVSGNGMSFIAPDSSGQTEVLGDSGKVLQQK